MTALHLYADGRQLTSRGRTGKYVFHHWEGDLTGDANPGIVSFDADNAHKAVTAVFMESSARHTITADVASTGGMVALNPLQPDDGYPVNTRVTVTAIADSGYVFSHWEGDIVGLTTNPASLTLNDEKTITAFFKPSIVVDSDPRSGGIVNLDPNWVATGYPMGTSVKVTAAPAQGYRFDHWTGDLSGSGNPASITMDSPKDVTAVFVEQRSSTFSWWWIVLGVVLLLAAVIVVLLIRANVSRRATEDWQ